MMGFIQTTEQCCQNMFAVTRWASSMNLTLLEQSVLLKNIEVESSLAFGRIAFEGLLTHTANSFFGPFLFTHNDETRGASVTLSWRIGTWHGEIRRCRIAWVRRTVKPG